MEQQPKMDRTVEGVAARSNPVRMIKPGYRPSVAREYMAQSQSNPAEEATAANVYGTKEVYTAETFAPVEDSVQQMMRRFSPPADPRYRKP
jgi:hypothetical protein